VEGKGTGRKEREGEGRGGKRMREGKGKGCVMAVGRMDAHEQWCCRRMWKIS